MTAALATAACPALFGQCIAVHSADNTLHVTTDADTFTDDSGSALADVSSWLNAETGRAGVWVGGAGYPADQALALGEAIVRAAHLALAAQGGAR